MNNVVSFDMMELAAAAKRATETIAQLKRSRDEVDLTPVMQCGHMMRRLLTNQAAAYNNLCQTAQGMLSSAAAEVDTSLNTPEKVRNFISEVVGTTRYIAKITDAKAIDRTEQFLLKLAS